MNTKVNGPTKVKGFDTDTVLSAQTAAEFYASGYQFCLRYISLGEEEAPGDLTAEEVANILESGLGLMPVQHVITGDSAGWTPTASLGEEYGNNAASHARALGFIPEVNVWCDLENIASGTSVDDVVAYCQAWHEAVNSAGFAPGLYVGDKCILSGEELYERLSFQHYWHSGSQVPEVAERGYQMIQTISPTSNLVHGVSIDVDEAITDQQGGTIQWMEKVD